MKKERSFKKYLSIALVLLLLAITSLTVAYWDKLTDTREDEIVLGERKSLTVTELVNIADKHLVPEGNALADGEVHKIEFDYKVTINKAVPNYKLYVAASINDPLLKISMGAWDANLLEQTITFTIAFDAEPADEAAYDDLMAKTLKYTIVFEYKE